MMLWCGKGFVWYEGTMVRWYDGMQYGTGEQVRWLSKAQPGAVPLSYSYSALQGRQRNQILLTAKKGVM